MATYQEHVFLNGWAGSNESVLKDEFGLDNLSLEGVKILLASYCRDTYTGEAFVLFCKDGQLYEVNASHDSVAGMIGQWEPEETMIEALHHRLERGNLGVSTNGDNLFANELRFLLAELKAC